MQDHCLYLDTILNCKMKPSYQFNDSSQLKNLDRLKSCIWQPQVDGTALIIFAAAQETSKCSSNGRYIWKNPRCSPMSCYLFEGQFSACCLMHIFINYLNVV